MSARPAHIHLDPIGGAAGDMFAGALLHALPHLANRVLADCRAVLPEGLTPTLVDAQNGAITGQRLALEGNAAKGASDYTALRARVMNAELNEGTSYHAAAILRALAEAEAAIHGVAVEAVHFHEVGDWDSLMDVVAAGSVIAACGHATFSISPLPLGGGTVTTRHGRLPVPAPATAALLKGLHTHDDGIPGERVTPTGAAILQHLTQRSRPGGIVSAQGYGVGTRTLPGMPNVLRALVFSAPATAVGQADTVALIELDIDDMTGEELSEAADVLRSVDGVLDVTVGSRIGKRGRPVSDIRIMALPAAADAVISAVFDQTSTLGLRHGSVQRQTLPRSGTERDGTRVKRAHRPGGTTAKAEARDIVGDTLAARRAARAKAEGGT